MCRTRWSFRLNDLLHPGNVHEKGFYNNNINTTITSFVWVRRCRIYFACFRNLILQYSHVYSVWGVLNGFSLSDDEISYSSALLSLNSPCFFSAMDYLWSYTIKTVGSHLSRQYSIMESMESYPELDVSVEGICEHIKASPSLELYIEGWFFSIVYIIDPSKWYCTSCSKAFSSREDIEDHSNTNMFELVRVDYIDITIAFIMLTMIV